MMRSSRSLKDLMLVDDFPAQPVVPPAGLIETVVREIPTTLPPLSLASNDDEPGYQGPADWRAVAAVLVLSTLGTLFYWQQSQRLPTESGLEQPGLEQPGFKKHWVFEERSLAPLSPPADTLRFPERAPEPTPEPTAEKRAPRKRTSPKAVAGPPPEFEESILVTAPVPFVDVTQCSTAEAIDLGPPPLPAGTDEAPNPFFEAWGTHPFIDTDDDPLSTFGLEVWTDSIFDAWSDLDDGYLPDKEYVIVEEFLNYLNLELAPPEKGDFAIHLDGAPTPFTQGERYRILRIGLRARGEVDRSEDAEPPPLVARNVRVQVEFNPRIVERYRLLGYENRGIADEDFLDSSLGEASLGEAILGESRVDGGKILEGHAVNALYEVKLRRRGAGGRLGEVRLRHRPADSDDWVETKKTIRRKALVKSWEKANPEMRLAAVVGELAEILRHSYWARDSDPRVLLAEMESLEAFLGEREDYQDLLVMVRLAVEILLEEHGTLSTPVG